MIECAVGDDVMPMVSDNLRNLASALTITALCIAALVLGAEILVPLALAVILAFMLAPIVRWLSAYFIPHGLSVAIVMTVMGAVIGAASIGFSSQLLSLTASLGTYQYNVAQKVRSVLQSSDSDDGVLKRASQSIDSLRRTIEREWSAKDEPSVPPAASPEKSNTTDKTVVIAEKAPNGEGLMTYMNVVSSPLVQVFLTFLFAMFLLLQHQDLRDRVVRVAGTDNMSETTSAMSEAGARLSSLFLMQAALNVGFGVFVGASLYFIGVPNSMLWGAAVTIMRFIPFIGSLLAAVPPVLLAAAVDPGWTMTIATAAVFLIGEPLMGHVIEPLVLGKRVGLSPFAMVAAASFWTLVWGPVGLILAAPLTMTLVVLGRYITGLEFVSILLGDDPALTPQQEFYHRILSGDSISAAEQFGEALKSSTYARAGDDVLLPGLRLAAMDQRRSRLDRDQIEEFKETMKESLGLIADEMSPDTSKSETQSHNVLVVAAHGPIDVLAANFAGAVLRNSSASTIDVAENASGLTALSDAAGRKTKQAYDRIVIVSVGSIDRQHLRFIVKRAMRDFPDAGILVLDGGWGGEPNPAVATDIDSSVTMLSRLSDVSAALGAADPKTKTSASVVSQSVRDMALAH